MAQKISIDGKSYDLDALSDAAKARLASIKFVDDKIKTLANQQAVLNRARNAYISDLKAEMIHAKTGVNINALFADD